MVDSVFPNTNDNMDEATLRAWAAAIANSLPYVRSGFIVTAGAGLTVNVAAGEAFDQGTRISRNVATNGVALTANATNYVFVSIDDALQNTVTFTVNTTGTKPAVPSVLLAAVVTSAAAVTSVTDRRNLTPVSRWRNP